MYNTLQFREGHLYHLWDGEIDYWLKVGSVRVFPDYLFQLDRYIYMFDTANKMSLAFDLFDGECLPMAPIYETRRFYSVVSVSGFIYVMGGYGDDFNNIKDIEVEAGVPHGPNGTFGCSCSEWLHLRYRLYHGR
ncbi:hypothetical protein AVEN_149447-1 [Araneus ventricosus]|uniref:Uncharacterized protein n=1 Tax=Araneus ventricosus TaxID=182803 RepID=A0A4Y2JGG8_ARAVE|nr:hypothetical protein AVEN_149447-1 [Araneus ventricosus]